METQKPTDIADQLAKIERLRADNVLTDKEFQKLKAKLINEGGSSGERTWGNSSTTRKIFGVILIIVIGAGYYALESSGDLTSFIGSIVNQADQAEPATTSSVQLQASTAIAACGAGGCMTELKILNKGADVRLDTVQINGRQDKADCNLKISKSLKLGDTWSEYYANGCGELVTLDVTTDRGTVHMDLK